VDQFAPNVGHFRNLMGLSVKMIDECHRRGIPTVLTLHDHWGICLKSLMLKNDGTVCTHGGFDCLDCKQTLTETMAIPSPIRNAHILLSLRKVDRLIAPSEHLAAMYIANGIPRAQIAVLRNEPIRQAMRRNGWNFVRSLKRATARSSKSGACRLGSLWNRHNGRRGPSSSVAVDTEGERPCTSASG